MAKYVNFEEAFKKLVERSKSGNLEQINEAKYYTLFETDNFFHLVSNFVFLNQIGVTFDYGKDKIKSGTKLFRIRKFIPNIDYSNAKEWEPNPNKQQNRANSLGEEALYLGSNENVCILETHLTKGEKYVVGTYEVVDDITVGGFFKVDPNNWRHNTAGIILNAFFIAPSRSKNNKPLFSMLDNLI